MFWTKKVPQKLGGILRPDYFCSSSSMRPATKTFRVENRVWLFFFAKIFCRLTFFRVQHNFDWKLIKLWISIAAITMKNMFLKIVSLSPNFNQYFIRSRQINLSRQGSVDSAKSFGGCEEQFGYAEKFFQAQNECEECDEAKSFGFRR